MTVLKRLPTVAREAISAALGRRSARLPAPDESTAKARPLFVTLRIDGKLRGCIGSLQPQCADLIAETADRAVAAALEDPRFSPMDLEDLRHCKIEVSVLGDLEDISSAADLNPRIYGLVVSDGHGRRGVLLPAIPTIDTPAQQIEIAERKAGIPVGSKVAMQRFRVESFRE